MSIEGHRGDLDNDVSRWLEFFLVHEADQLYVILQRLREHQREGDLDATSPINSFERGDAVSLG